MIDRLIPTTLVGSYPQPGWLVQYGPIILGTIKEENKMHRIAPSNRRKAQKQSNKTDKPLPMS